MLLSGNTGNYCKSCRWYYGVDGKVGRCTEVCRCSVNQITDYQTETQSCYRWKPRTGLTVSTGTNLEEVK